METCRLILRRYEAKDLQDLYEYLSDPDVVRFEPYKPMTRKEVVENLAWRMDTDEMIAVELKENHKMIGNIYLGKRDFDSLELGYAFNRIYWGKGYAYEGASALIEQAFKQGIHRIYAECDPLNTDSWKFLEGLDFQREAHLRENIFFWRNEEGMPVWKDTYVYAKLKEARNDGEKNEI